MGWYGPPGLIGICAWDAPSGAGHHRRELARRAPALFQKPLSVERRLLTDEEERELLGSFAGSFDDRSFELRWSAGQARAFQLLNILPHELGHHHDRITTSGKRRPQRGESYAENYANHVLGEGLADIHPHIRRVGQRRVRTHLWGNLGPGLREQFRGLQARTCRPSPHSTRPPERPSAAAPSSPCMLRGRAGGMKAASKDRSREHRETLLPRRSFVTEQPYSVMLAPRGWYLLELRAHARALTPADALKHRRS